MALRLSKIDLSQLLSRCDRKADHDQVPMRAGELRDLLELVDQMDATIGSVLNGQKALKEQTMRIRATALDGAPDPGEVDTQDIVAELVMRVRHGL